MFVIVIDYKKSIEAIDLNEFIGLQGFSERVSLRVISPYATF